MHELEHGIAPPSLPAGASRSSRAGPSRLPPSSSRGYAIMWPVLAVPILVTLPAEGRLG